MHASCMFFFPHFPANILVTIWMCLISWDFSGFPPNDIFFIGKMTDHEHKRKLG